MSGLVNNNYLVNQNIKKYNKDSKIKFIKLIDELFLINIDKECVRDTIEN